MPTPLTGSDDTQSNSKTYLRERGREKKNYSEPESSRTRGEGALAPPYRESAAMISAPLFCAPHWHHPGSCLARLLKLVTLHADGG